MNHNIPYLIPERFPSFYGQKTSPRSRETFVMLAAPPRPCGGYHRAYLRETLRVAGQHG